MNLDYRTMRLFYYVVKLGSISKAAKYLNLAQSAASQRIRYLEDIAGGELLTRDVRGAIPTRIGENFFEKIEAALAILENLKDASGEVEEVKGHFKISTSHAIASTWLMDCLAGFLKQYPKVTFNIIAKDEALDLRLREADISIHGYPKDIPDYEQYEIVKFSHGLFASQEYLEKNGFPKSLRDLDSHKLIIFGSEDSYAIPQVEWVLRAGRKAGNPYREPYLSVNSIHAMIEAAEKGLGIIAFSRESPLIKKSLLVEILKNCKGPEPRIYLTYPKSINKLKAIKELTSHILSYKVYE